MLWVTNVLRQLRDSGVLMGDKSRDDYFPNMLVKSNNLEADVAALKMYHIEQNTSVANCGDVMVFGAEKCKLNRLCETMRRDSEFKEAVFDLGIQDKSTAERVLNYALETARAPHTAWILSSSAEPVTGYFCDGCHYKYRLEILLHRLNHAPLSLKIYLAGVAEPSEFTFIGVKRKSQTKTREGKLYSEANRKMAMLGVRSNERSFLVVKSEGRLALLEIKKHLKSGLVSREVLLIETVMKGKDLESAIYNDKFTVVAFDIDQLYVRDGKEGSAVNIHVGNNELFVSKFKDAYPDDGKFKDIRVLITKVGSRQDGALPDLDPEFVALRTSVKEREASKLKKKGGDASKDAKKDESKKGDESKKDDEEDSTETILNILMVLGAASVLIFVVAWLIQPTSGSTAPSKDVPVL